MQETVLRGETRNVTQGQRVGSASEGGSLETRPLLARAVGLFFFIQPAALASLFRQHSPSPPRPLPPTIHTRAQTASLPGKHPKGQPSYNTVENERSWQRRCLVTVLCFPGSDAVWARV